MYKFKALIVYCIFRVGLEHIFVVITIHILSIPGGGGGSCFSRILKILDLFSSLSNLHSIPGGGCGSGVRVASYE